jgi:hypothetical protein
MEHEDRHIAGIMFVCADKEGAERLAIGRRDEQLFVVTEAELRRSGHIGSGVWGEASRIDEFAAKVSECAFGPGAVAHFCLKYNRLLQRAATPEDAISGNRRYDTNESKAEVMVVDLVWGICREGIYMSFRGRWSQSGACGNGDEMCLHLSTTEILKCRAAAGCVATSKCDDLGVSPGVAWYGTRLNQERSQDTGFGVA